MFPIHLLHSIACCFILCKCFTFFRCGYFLSSHFFRIKMTKEMEHYHWRICFLMSQFIPFHMMRFLYFWVCIIYRVLASDILLVACFWGKVKHVPYFILYYFISFQISESYLIFHTSYLIFHFVCFIFHTSYFIFDFSYLAFIWYFVCHISCLMFHICYLIFHILYLIFHIGYLIFHVLYFIFYIKYFIFHIR